MTEILTGAERGGGANLNSYANIARMIFASIDVGISTVKFVLAFFGYNMTGRIKTLQE